MNPPKRETLAFTVPNTARVMKELDLLIAEWRDWEKEVHNLPEHPYAGLLPQPFDVLKDGEDNLKKHRILQEKTLVFLDNNIAGHGFIYGRDASKIDAVGLPLKFRVKHRLDDLDELWACLQYAKVPEAYWSIKAKEMLERLAGKAPDLATDLAAKYLQGLM